MHHKPGIIVGAVHQDERGSLQYVNEELPGNYRRFYVITHPHTQIVRAWQGHKIEEKSFLVLKGTFIIAVVQPQNFENPSASEKPEIFTMKKEDNLFLKVPGGCYTGIKACIPDSELLVLSDSILEHSQKDDFRLSADMWIDWETIQIDQNTIND